MTFNLTSLRSRITLVNMALMGAIVVIFALVVHYGVRTVLLTSIDRDLARRVSSMATPVVEILAPAKHTSTQSLPRTIGSESVRLVSKGNKVRSVPAMPGYRLTDVRILRVGRNTDKKLDGDELSAKSPKLIELWPSSVNQGEPTYTYETTAGEAYRVFYYPLTQRGKVSSIVRISYDLGELNRFLRGLDLSLMFLAPISLLIVGAMASLLTGNSLRPVSRITIAAQKADRNDLSFRLPVDGDDEFARLSEAFNDMLSRLEQTFDAQKQFVSDAAHELKTPLTTVLAHSTWALQRDRPESEYREALEGVVLAGHRMKSLVDDLLELAIVDSQPSLVKVPCDIRLTLLEVSRNSVVPDQKAKIEVYAPQGLSVDADQGRLNQILTNLLDNALRYGRPDGLVRLSAELVEDNVEIVILDDGVGIGSEHICRLGERFYRTELSRNRSEGGTGLGLAICSELIKLHGGNIRFESEIGLGTKVTVSLPVS